MNQDLYTAEQVAHRLGLEPHTLAKWRSANDGPPYIKVGTRVRYTEADLNAWISQQRNAAGMAS